MGKFKATITDPAACKSIAPTRYGKCGEVSNRGSKTVLSQLEKSLNKFGATDIHRETKNGVVTLTATVPDAPKSY